MSEWTTTPVRLSSASSRRETLHLHVAESLEGEVRFKYLHARPP